MYKINSQIEQKIKEYFKDWRICAVQIGAIRKFFKENKIAEEYVKDILNEEPLYENITNIFQHILFNINLAKCKTCGKTLTWRQRKNEFCSKKCSMTNPEVIEKRKNTVKEKFGTEFIYQSEYFKQKRKKSLIEHYGVDDPLKSTEVWKKIKDNNIKKYGVEFFSQTNEFIEKRQETWVDKYGVKNPMHNAVCKEKRNQTNLKKYGFKDPMCAHRWATIQSFKDYVIPLFDESELEPGSEKVYKWKCVKCGNEFEQRMYNTNHLKEVGEQVPRCLKCFPLLFLHSKKEKEVVEFIKEIYPDEIVENDRNQIKPYELDVFLPKLKLAIEFDGEYWHQEGKNKPIGYHQMKDEMCSKIGIDILHIKENDWDFRKEETKNLICQKIKEAGMQLHPGLN